MRQLGKKGLEWKRERRKRLKELEATGEYVVEGTLLFGNCTDCGRYGILDLDHKDGRGGDDPHRMSNLDPVCRMCHNRRHKNNHMSQKDKKTDTKSKKPNWMKDHACKHCKAVGSMLLCQKCGKLSV